MHDPDVVAFDIRIPWPGRRYGVDLVTVWHREPGGRDALTVCRTSRWKWHVHHWRLQLPPLQAARRRLLTRCAWCGGRSRRGDPVNHSLSWGGLRGPWWRGERGLYHSDCAGVYHAHQMCLCDRPALEHGDYGTCASCGNYRGWRQEPNAADRYLAALPHGARVPADKRDWLVQQRIAARR